MASGPYQSNVLRFFVGQYRQGLDRHRRVVDQTRSNIVLGGELGAAVALVPVYAVLRASHTVRQKLTQSVQKLQLAARRTQAKKLIDFSAFKAMTAAPTHTEACKAEDLEMMPAALPLALAREVAEASMLEALVAVGDALLPAQISSLAESPAGWRFLRSRGQGLIRRVASRLTSAVDDSAELAAACGRTAGQSQITGVASDLKTRSLILILGYKTAWDGLSLTQQAYIQHQTSRFFNENSPTGPWSLRLIARPSDAEAQSLQPRAKKPMPVAPSNRSAGALVQSIYSFWIAVLQVIGGLQGRTHRQPVAFLFPDLRLPGLHRLTGKASHIRLASAEVLRLMGSYSSSQHKPTHAPAVPGRILLSAKVSLPSTRVEMGLRNSQQAVYADADQWLEASVVSVDYVEHPLERLLKWVDKILLWLERRWQILLTWRSQRHSAQSSQLTKRNDPK